MAKQKSSSKITQSAKITQREYVRKRTRRADIAKLAKFKPLRVAEIPQEKIQQAAQAPGGQEAPSTAYPENAPEAADNPQAPLTPEKEQPKTQSGGKPGEAERPGGEEPPAPGEQGAPAGDQPPKEDQEGQEQGKEPEGEEKKPEEEEKPEDEEGQNEGAEGEGEGPEGDEKGGEEGGEGEGGEDKDKDKKEGAAEKEAEKEAKKGIRALAKAAWQIISKAIMSALTWLTSTIGWPIIIGCGVIALIILAFSIVIGAHFYTIGPIGKSGPQPGGTGDPSIPALNDLNKQKTRADYFKLDYLTARDKEYIQTGKMDRRLGEVLVWLINKHERIRVSHIISEYEDMPVNNESGTESNSAVVNNISAHKDGLAADLDELDFVFKVFEDTDECDEASDGAMTDIVYYNDLEEELFRIECLTPKTAKTKANTTFKNNPAIAIPIQIRWQDKKPSNIKWLENVEDPGDTTDPTQKEIYQKVYQPEARRKVHLVIDELLKYPSEKGDPTKYRLVQLITFSFSRDVQPFSAVLDDLYGQNRSSNFGLFSMNEAWWNLHLAY